jgi:hypothetical protein
MYLNILFPHGSVIANTVVASAHWWYCIYNGIVFTMVLYLQWYCIYNSIVFTMVVHGGAFLPFLSIHLTFAINFPNLCYQFT